MTRNDRRLVIALSALLAPLVLYLHQTHCVLRLPFRDMKMSGGNWAELIEFHHPPAGVDHEDLKGSLKQFKFGVSERLSYETSGPFYFQSSRKHCFVRRYFTEVVVYDGPTDPAAQYHDGVPRHTERFPIAGTSEICFVNHPQSGWKIQGRMLSEKEDQAENGPLIFSTFATPPEEMVNDPAYFGYQTNRGRFREWDFPVRDDASFWSEPLRFGGFHESFDFSLVAKAMIRGTEGPPRGPAGLVFFSFDFLSPDLRRVPEIDISVFETKSKVLRGRIRLRFCGYLQAMASTLNWIGADLLSLGAPCCGERDQRRIFGYFPKE